MNRVGIGQHIVHSVSSPTYPGPGWTMIWATLLLQKKNNNFRGEWGEFKNEKKSKHSIKKKKNVRKQKEIKMCKKVLCKEKKMEMSIKKPKGMNCSDLID